MTKHSRITLSARTPPRIERAVRAVHPADQGTITHRYKTTALHLYEYPARVRVGRHTYALQPGDLTLTPPDTAKQYWFGTDGRHWCVHFYPAENRSRDRIRLPIHLRLGERASHAAECLREIVDLANPSGQTPEQERLRQAEAAHRFQSLLLWFARTQAAVPARRGRCSGKGIERMAAYVREHLPERLDVGRLAAVAGLSRNYLARCFRQRFGTTMLRYVLACRIDRARELLETTDAPIQSIAAQVGLPDLQHFNKRFRRVTGLSPTAWREQYAERTDGRTPYARTP